MNNISEGFERGTNREFARFLEFAKGSAGEVRNMYSLATDLNYLSSDTAKERKILCRRISAGLSSLVSYLRSHEGPRPKCFSEDSIIRDRVVRYEMSGR